MKMELTWIGTGLDFKQISNRMCLRKRNLDGASNKSNSTHFVTGASGIIWVLGHRLHTLVRRIEMEDDLDDSDDYFVFFAPFLDMFMCYLIVLSSS